jgi:hypothetical protein
MVDTIQFSGALAKLNLANRTSCRTREQTRYKDGEESKCQKQDLILIAL